MKLSIAYIHMHYYKYQISMSAFNAQLYQFLRLAEDQIQYLIYEVDGNSHIYINNYKENQIFKVDVGSLAPSIQQKTNNVITKLLRQELHLSSIQLHQQLLIMQMSQQDISEPVIVPIQLMVQVGQDYKKVQNMYLIYRQNMHIKQREELLCQIDKLNQKIGQIANKAKIEDVKNQSESTEDQKKVKSQAQIKEQNLEERCRYLNSKCNQLHKKLQVWQGKFQLVSQANKELQQSLQKARIRQLNNRQTEQKRTKYLVNHYDDYTSVTIANKQAYQTIQNRNTVYTNQFTEYIQAKPQKKLNKTKDGFNQFIFEPFTIGKYISCFYINDKNIRFRDKVDIYYQLTSFHGVPMTGKTRIGFKVIRSKNGNILVGILLAIRKRLRYSYQHPNMISYKIKGGKYGLYEDGVPVSLECEQINVDDCLWMIINRQNNTIQFTKEKSIVRTMPKRFQTAGLYPFITMKDQDDQLQII